MFYIPMWYHSYLKRGNVILMLQAIYNLKNYSDIKVMRFKTRLVLSLLFCMIPPTFLCFLGSSRPNDTKEENCSSSF